MKKFKIEVIADQSGTWAGNAMVYDVYEEAREAAINLAHRWMLVTKARVVEFDQENPRTKEITKEVWGC